MKLKTTVNITSSPELVLKEGVIANNDILNFEEFSEFMKPRLIGNVLNDFLIRLQTISNSIKRENYKEAYLQWEQLETNILANDDYAVSLLFIGNIDSEQGNFSYSYNTKEYDILSKKGYLTRLSQLNKQLFQTYLEAYVNKHLAELMEDIQTKKLSPNDRQKIFEIGNSDQKRSASNARWHTHNWTYQNILYGENPQWRGNAADAFVNHLGHMHVQILANGVEDKDAFAISVFQEEKDNIFKLLFDSTNKISWYTGGDIVVKYQNELYNIQLKTGIMEKNGSRRSRIGDQLAIKNLSYFVDNLQNTIKNQDVDQLIIEMYNELKTSGWVEKVNQSTEIIAQNLTKEIFSGII